MPRSKQQNKELFPNFDKLPDEVGSLEYLCARLDTPAIYYRFEKIELPCFEDAKLYAPLIKAGMCEEFAPVQLKMKKGGDIALMLSGIFSTLRMFMQHKMDDDAGPAKFLFSGDTYYAAPAKDIPLGSRTEWTVVLVDECPVTEAEIIQILWRAFEEMGLEQQKIEFRIHATGCSTCRATFRSTFGLYLRSRASKLCKSCKQGMKQYPTGVLRCKEEKCGTVAANAPQMLDFLCDVCKKHFKGVLEFLDESRIPYILDGTLFREGSWYSNAVFEFRYKPATPSNHESVGEAMVLLAEGGRVSRAAKLIFGKRIEAVSGSVFLRSVAHVLNMRQQDLREQQKCTVFLIQLGELAKRKSLNMLEILRTHEIAVHESLGRDSIRAQFKAAERVGAEVALVLGQKEALDETVIIREISSGMQETIAQSKLIDFLKKKYIQQV